MAINNFNNSIGFPRLTNNSSGMFMTPPVSEEVKIKPVEIPEKQIPQMQNTGSEKSGSAESQKYFIGAAAIAASAIAGIYLYKSRSSAAKQLEQKVDEYANAIPKTVPHLKDNFLAAIGDAPDLDFVNKQVKSLLKRVRVDKNGKSILKKDKPVFAKRGISIVDECLQPSALVQRTFVTDDGKELARIDFDGDGKVWQYFVKDLKGNVIRDYNFSEPGLTTKKIFNKNNKQVLDIQYNDKGWTYEVRYNEDGTIHSTNELNPHLKNPED